MRGLSALSHVLDCTYGRIFAKMSVCCLSNAQKFSHASFSSARKNFSQHRSIRDIPWFVISWSTKSPRSARLHHMKANGSTLSAWTSNRRILNWEFKAVTVLETRGSEAQVTSVVVVDEDNKGFSLSTWASRWDSCPKFFGHALHCMLLSNLCTFSKWRIKFFEEVHVTSQCPQLNDHAPSCEQLLYVWREFVWFGNWLDNLGKETSWFWVTSTLKMNDGWKRDHFSNTQKQKPNREIWNKQIIWIFTHHERKKL